MAWLTLAHGDVDQRDHAHEEDQGVALHGAGLQAAQDLPERFGEPGGAIDGQADDDEPLE